ncbi:MAG TPA: DUF416 family protein [Flavobacteriales bacterium]|nr:DUF416 family protein [Flavobacteriales bacterium]
MEYSTFTSRLGQRLNKMADADLLRFGTEICKRLYPDYAAFVRKHQWGDADLLLDAISVCDRTLPSDPDPEIIRGLRIRIDTIIPDTDDFGDFNGSYALNASAAVAYVLQFLLDKSPENIKYAAALYYDNTDMKLHELGISHEVELERHPRMEETRRFLLGE